MALSDSQYQEIMRDYERTRDENRRLSEERRAKIYREIPEIKELNDSVGSIARERLQLLLDQGESAGNGTSSSLPESPYQAISARRKALLHAAGYPEDYLEPIYDCPDCRDTGYVTLPNGLKEKCECLRRKEAAYTQQMANFNGISPEDRFSRLTYRYVQGEDLDMLQKTVGTCLDFVRNFHTDPGQNLLFFGTVGTGKSFISGCIANELLEKGCSVVYFSAVSFFDTLSRYVFSSADKESLYNYCQNLYNYDLVIVDDLGTEVLSSFVTSQFFAFLNEREVRKKSVIISTNLNLSELRDRYSDRVFSRLSKNFDICEFSGPDVRMCQKLGE